MTASATDAPRPWGVYVHVPWCRARCPYCSFQVVPLRDTPPWQPFVERVLAELEAHAPHFDDAPSSVFLGGGTPSRLPPVALERLLAGLPRAQGAEVCAEVNPEDVDETWLDGALRAGIDRLSVGVQTFDERQAKLLGRAHTVRMARDALARIVRSGVRSWSLDLMFAVPGQTLADLERELDAVLELAPPHVSLYGLTFEPGTRFERARERGRLQPLDDELWRTMYERIVERLEGAGLHRYEVSNFARTGHRSRHNTLYWTDRPYLGLGPSAHGYWPDGSRRINPGLDGWLAGEAQTIEKPTPVQAAVDLLVSCLRSTDGVDRARLRARTGLRIDEGTLDALRAAHLLTASAERVQLTAAGFPVCDGIVARLADTLRG